jgi:RNA polymerase sigma factor (TIGR02999 family)
VENITQLLRAMENGEPRAAEQLLAVVYDELRRLAAAKMAHERAGHTLQPTALVHEAWLRLGGNTQPPWQNRRHFFGAAAEGLGGFLLAGARRKQAARRGSSAEHVDLGAGEFEIASPVPEDDVLRVHEALDQLAIEDPRKAELVKLRYFVGLSIEEAAAILGISARTAKTRLELRSRLAGRCHRAHAQRVARRRRPPARQALAFNVWRKNPLVVSLSTGLLRMKIRELRHAS